MPAPTLQERAREVIDKLKTSYSGNKFEIDFFASQLIAGDNNKQLRQEIIYQATGEHRPVSKAGLHAVTDTLKAKFDQIELFA